MNFKLNSSTGRQTKSKLLPKIVILLLIVGLGFSLFLHFRGDASQNPPQGQTESDESVGEVPTYQAESEGKSINVPTNIEPESIKDYELITENEQYKIRKLDNKYTITLYAIINNPNQRSAYLDQLREYKQNALDYLQKQDINTSNADIIYEPHEATSL